MNDVIKNLSTLFDAAYEENMNGHGNDITRMVTTFVPNAIQNLQAYEDMFKNIEGQYDHIWDMYLDEFEDIEIDEELLDRFNSVPLVNPIRAEDLKKILERYKNETN